MAAGKPFWFEASAILFDGKSLLVAHDKPMPDGRASVGSWSGFEAMSVQKKQPVYFPEEPFRKAIKYEEFAQSPDGKWTFLTTAFDRVKEGSSDWDSYNTMLCWPTGKPASVSVLAGNAEGNSVALRKKISLAMALTDSTFYDIVRYFKIEGLAATNDRLIVGIREEGNTYQDFNYVVRLLAIPYQVLGQGAGQHVELTDHVDPLAVIDITKQTNEKLPANLAVSSIEYDAVRGIFWLITTFETPKSVGAYLWTATEKDLKAGKMNLVRTPAGVPLRLTHKAEDMTFLTPQSLLLINDDDRLPTQIGNTVRKANQAAYTVLSVD